MTQPAELRACYLVISGSDGREVHANGEAGHGILLETHQRNEKTVNDVMSAQNHFDLAVHWGVHGAGDDVVFGSGIGGVYADSALAARGGIDQFRLGAGKFSVRPGITEVPGELHSGDFHLQGPGLSGTKTL